MIHLNNNKITDIHMQQIALIPSHSYIKLQNEQMLKNAVIRGDLNTVRAYLDQGVNINAIDLREAISKGDLQITELLISRNADIYKVDASGETLVAFALSLRKKESEKIAQILIDADLNHQALPYAKEYLSRKHIAHLFSIKGLSWLSTKMDSTKQRVELESSYPHYFINAVVKATEIFSGVFPNFIDPKVLELLKETYQIASDQAIHSNLHIFKRWQQGLPILIRTGFSGHHVMILVWDHFFVICNRGDALDPSEKTIRFFKFIKKNFSIEWIDYIQKITDKTDYINLFHFNLAKALNFHQTKFEKTLETINTPRQTAGICCWSNSEGLFLPFLLLADSQLGEKKELLASAPIANYQLGAKKRPLDSPIADRQADAKKRRLDSPIADRQADAKKKKNDLLAIIKQKKHLYHNWNSLYQINTLQGYLDEYMDEEKIYTPDFNLLSKAFTHHPIPQHKIDGRIVKMWKTGKKEFEKLCSKSIRDTIEE